MTCAKKSALFRHTSKEISMNRNVMGIAFGATLALTSVSVLAQTWTVPAPSVRCPSKWGAADTRGSANHMNTKSVMRAKELMRSGEVIEMAHPLNAQMPFFGTRRFDVHTKRTFMNDFSNRRGSNEEMVLSEIGQVGTQFDGFAHQTHEDSHYNCVKTGDIETRGGFKKFGMETVGTLMTRGVLIDVAGLKGVATLPDAYEITVEDLEAAMKRQNLTIQPGDAVLIHTGWGLLYGKENARYVKTCPGIGVKAAEFLAKLDPMLIGADNWPVEVAPNPDPKLSLPVHQVALVVHGIHLLENLKLDEMAAKRIYEFAFVMQPLKAAGFSGSTVAPVAIR
jgi:kynurenine formamidase